MPQSVYSVKVWLKTLALFLQNLNRDLLEEGRLKAGVISNAVIPERFYRESNL